LHGMKSGRVFMTTDAVGGVWSYALELARGLSGADIETTLAVMGPVPDMDRQSDARSIAGLTLIQTGLPLDWDRNVDEARLADAGADLADMARDVRADVVHLNSPMFAAHSRFPAAVVGLCHSCLTTWWQAVKCDVPLPGEFVWRGKLLREGYERCQVLVAPSLAFARATAAAHGLDATPTVVHNGRNNRVPIATPQPVTAAVFTAGRLWDEGKNALTLDRVAALLNSPIDAAGSTVAPGGENVRFEHLRILRLLSETQIAARLAMRPIFISISHYEPFGLAVLEAALAGCALVLSDIPTFRELWDGAATFVPATDAPAIARSLNTLLDQPGVRQQRGMAAAERASSYSTARMTNQMAAIYADLTGASSFLQRARQVA